MVPATLERRFWEKTNARDAFSCWEWLACTDKRTGYGKLGVENARWDRAHRVSWRIHVGDIPAGVCVLHKCDNRLCVNPTHLYLGDRGDNARDRERRGRGNHAVGRKHGRYTHPGQTSGSKNGRAKLVEVEVEELLRKHFKQGRIKASLSREYGLTGTTVGHIVSGKLWPNVKGRV